MSSINSLNKIVSMYIKHKNIKNKERKYLDIINNNSNNIMFVENTPKIVLNNIQPIVKQKLDQIILNYYKFNIIIDYKEHSFLILFLLLYNPNILEDFKKINSFKNSINRSINTIRNQQIKLRNYTHKASVGIANCENIIRINHEKIFSNFQSFFQYIINKENLEEIFLNIMKRYFKEKKYKNIDIINSYRTKELNENNNLKKSKNDLIKLEKNKDFLEKNKKKSEYYKLAINKNSFTLFFSRKFNNKIKKMYKKYKIIIIDIFNNLNILSNKNKEISIIEEKLFNYSSSIKKHKTNINYIDKNINIIDEKIFRMKRLKNEFVYIISNNKEGIYKIGKSNDYKKRIKTLSTGSFKDYKIIKVFQCWNMSQVETYLHNYFSEERVRREFFELDIATINAIPEILNKKFGRNTLEIYNA